MGEIKEAVIKGTIYTGVAKYSSLVVSLIVTAILSRSLEPKDFGTVAIATFFINFFSTLTISGFSPAIIQNRSLCKDDISNIYSFTIVLGLFLSLFFVLSSHTIASFYEENKYLEKICYILSINIFFSIICIVPNAILLKDKEFKFISIRMLSVNTIGGLLSILAIIFKFGIYSLVVNPVFSSIVIYLVTIKKIPIKYKLLFKWTSIKKILNYSVYQMLFNFVYLLYRGIDKLIIGRFFNLRMLGFYEKSYHLMLLPLENVSSVIAPVLHPILSEIQNDHSRVYNSYIKLVNFLSEIGFLLTVYIFFSGRELMLLLYGSQWEPAIPIFKVLSISIGIQVAQSPVGPILQTYNKVKDLFVCSVICLIFVLLALFVGILAGSMIWLAWCLTLAFYIIYLIYNFVICKISGQKIDRIIRCVCLSVVKIIPLCIILLVADIYTIGWNMMISFSLKTSILLIYFIFMVRVGVYNDIPVSLIVPKIFKNSDKIN